MRTSRGARLALAFFFGILPASFGFAAAPEALCSSPLTIFCSGFEEGSFSIWDDYDGNPAPWNSLVTDPGPLNIADNHATVLHVPPGRGGTDLVKVLPAQRDVVYVRWYQKWEQGFDFSVGMHGGGIHAGDRNFLGHSDTRPTGSDWFSSWLEPLNGRLNLYVYYRGMYQDCSNPNGSCWGDHFPCFLDEGTNYCKKAIHREHVMPPVLQTERWYCLEMMVNSGTPVADDAQADGSLNLWIDGVEYGPFNNLWLRTTSAMKPSILWLGLFHHADHSVAGTRFDNVVVSTSRVGCLNSKIPNAPTNLQIGG